MDTVTIAAISVGTVALFYVDVTSPRGLLDGVGYAAIVAMCTRFGRIALTAGAAITSALIVVAAFFLPNIGISVTGEIANRAFGLASVWIVAGVLLERLRLEDVLAHKDQVLRQQQETLRVIFLEVVMSSAPLEARIRRLTELAGRAVDVDRIAVFRLMPDGSSLSCLDYFDGPGRRHLAPEDLALVRPGQSLDILKQQLVVAADDVRTARYLEGWRELLKQQKIAALMTAAIFLGDDLAGLIAFGSLDEAHRWSQMDVAFAREIANYVALLFSIDRNEQVLAALDLTTEGIYATGRSGEVIYANRAARDIACIEDRLAAPQIPAEAFPHPAHPLTGVSDLAEIEYSGRNLEVHRARLPGDGVITRIDDVTLRNAAARERAALEERLQQASRMEALGQLAGGVAHDFNNILGAISGFAGFIAEDLPEGSPDRNFAGRILNACDRAKKLVEQVLDFSRTRTVERHLLDLERTFYEAANRVLASCPDNIVFRHASAGPAMVSGNSSQLSQMILNLYTNAADSIGGRAGTIILSLRPADKADIARALYGRGTAGEILIGDVGPANGYACITLSDTGAGVPADVLPRIFDPFYTTKGRARGSGLGLAVVHGVVTSHNGLCHARSVPNEGTTFSIFLPLASADEQAAIGEADGDGKEANACGKERVIVVDDEPDIVDALVIGLTRLGYEAVGAVEPTDVLQSLEEDPSAWDLIITDQVMPAMSGLELIRKVKTVNPAIRTILHTGFSEGTEGDASVQEGADAFVRKPAQVLAIARCIRQLCGLDSDAASPNLSSEPGGGVATTV